MRADELKPADAVWHRFLPRQIRVRLDGRHGLQAAISNSGWLFGDKLLRMGTGLLVGVWVVRYLGPTQLGLLSYAGAFAGLFGTLAMLGLDGIVVRELIRQPERQPEIMGSAFGLKVASGALALAVSLLAVAIAKPGDTEVLVLVGITAAGFIFQSLNVIDFYFQSTVQSKFTVYAANGAYILMTIAKIALLLTSASLIGFALVGLGEVVLTSVFLAVAYRRQGKHVSNWKFRTSVAKELLSHSWTQMLASLAIMIYMRIDQVMIGQMMGPKEVGLFAASVRLSEIWYFIPMGIASSVFPALMRAKAQGEAVFLARVQTLYDLMAWLGISVAIVTTLLSHRIVGLLYGSQFSESADVLSIQIWAGVMVCLGVVNANWLMVENLQRYNMYYTATGAVLNVVFNLILIPLYGIKGAACATLIAQFFPNLMQLFIKKARPNLFLMLRSFLAPIRLARRT